MKVAPMVAIVRYLKMKILILKTVYMKCSMMAINAIANQLTITVFHQVELPFTTLYSKKWMESDQRTKII